MRAYTTTSVVLLALYCSVATAVCVSATKSSMNVPHRRDRVDRIIRETLFVTRGDLWSDGNPRIDPVLINGTLPGPTLRFRPGDVALVKVFNHIPNENLTIHFHGLSQALVPAADGTPMLSQWPIALFNFFEYELHITEQDAGSTFYHSHVGVQITTAHGALIVEDEQPTLPARAEERVMLLGYYFYASDKEIMDGLQAVPFKWPGSANGILLIGSAWTAAGGCNESVANRQNTICSRSSYQGPSVIDVDYDRPCRLRWIGAVSHAPCRQHSQPFTDNHRRRRYGDVELLGGQRYDTVVQSKCVKEVEEDGMGGCYPIRFESRWRSPPTNGWAMLRYPGAQCKMTMSLEQSSNSSSFLAPAKFGWLSHRLHPLLPSSPGHASMPRDDEVTRQVVLQAQQVPLSANKEFGIRWDSNVRAFNESTPIRGDGITIGTPYLGQLYRNATVAPSYVRAMHPQPGHQTGYDALSRTYVAKAGEVLDIVLINNNSAISHTIETHPWHFHGQNHWTIAMGKGNFTPSEFAAAKLRFAPAIARDTSGVWPGKPSENGAHSIVRR